MSCKTLNYLICPHQNRPNYCVHALARFLSSCRLWSYTHGGFCLIPFFPKSILPRSFREQFHPHSWVHHQHSWSTDTTAASSSSSLSHCQAQQGSPACRALWLENLLGLSREFLCPYHSVWELWFQNPLGYSVLRERMLVVTGRMVISYSLKWNKPYRKLCVLCSWAAADVVGLTSWKALCFHRHLN